MDIWKRITSYVLCAGLFLAPMNGIPEKPAVSMTVTQQQPEPSE